ncbi:hypothetical protein CIHG_05279 [Coccidioides immitis H538.4]|uniref:Uncharacterized protein n=3 Tax=Coccidioides immitis TaxID=5501 RepID=A0A0J8R4M9_COCIT|nr:hypothetical protein CIRG_08345 [Coccidioides immitis RMSCC 2394]KMU78663.1 hypothetical protein CISG_01703 [Coccidioides immitis RMSCC 3703]KMU87483.1 hypothetical protein CIHG_05279 [Coccidioides immitis H538.4]
MGFAHAANIEFQAHQGQGPSYMKSKFISSQALCLSESITEETKKVVELSRINRNTAEDHHE